MPSPVVFAYIVGLILGVVIGPLWAAITSHRS